MNEDDELMVELDAAVAGLPPGQAWGLRRSAVRGPGDGSSLGRLWVAVGALLAGAPPDVVRRAVAGMGREDRRRFAVLACRARDLAAGEGRQAEARLWAVLGEAVMVAEAAEDAALVEVLPTGRADWLPPCPVGRCACPGAEPIRADGGLQRGACYGPGAA